MINRSLNEIEHICRKAARGCGLPWGVADEVGKAVRWLHVFEIDGVSCLVDLLSRYDHHHHVDYAPKSLEGVWQSRSESLSPLMVGTSLCDCMEYMQDADIQTSEINYPVLTAGFLGQTALTEDQAVSLKWASVELVLYRERLLIKGHRDDLQRNKVDALFCARASFQDKMDSSDSGITHEITQEIGAVIGNTQIAPDTWEKLEQYAYLTYVKGTEASRLSGAGAGLNDND